MTFNCWLGRPCGLVSSASFCSNRTRSVGFEYPYLFNKTISTNESSSFSRSFLSVRILVLSDWLSKPNPIYSLRTDLSANLRSDTERTLLPMIDWESELDYDFCCLSFWTWFTILSRFYSLPSKTFFSDFASSRSLSMHILRVSTALDSIWSAHSL